MEALGRNSRLLTTPDADPQESSAVLDDFSPDVGGRLSDGPTHRLVPLLAWLAAIVTLVFIPLKIIGLGYLPSDDALRHAAKAVSGRDWSDVLVVQEQFRTDHNPGWHWILGRVHEATGANADGLVTLSVAGLVLLFLLLPLPWLRRPEAWLVSILAGIIAFPNMLLRIFLGRPFTLSIAATLAILLLWRNRKQVTPALLAGTTLLFALGAWVHGSWYLFSLIVAAFALAGELSSAVRLGACWISGSILAGLLTGHPIAFLWNAVNIGITCFSQHQLQRMLVIEFGSSDGDPVTLLLVGVLICIRVMTGGWRASSLKNPIFMLAVLGWIFGLRVIRFWADWGQPALSLWIAFELQEHFESILGSTSLRRLFVTAGICLSTFFAVTADSGGRWTNQLTVEYLNENDAEMAPWLPSEGGILYAADMRIFYRTFFRNPFGKWKYMLGFEPTFMPPEDLKIYRNIQWNFNAYQAYEPWVKKMRPQDRLVISGGNRPGIPQLEWKMVARETWVGRLAAGSSEKVGPVSAPASSR